MGFSRDHCTHLLCEEHDKNIKEINDAAARQKRTQEGPAGGVIDVSDDELTVALSEAYFPSEQREAQLLANERKMSELSKCNEEYQERLQTLSDVFEKASAPDRPAEVGLSLQATFSRLSHSAWRSLEMCAHASWDLL
jgi:hypothetical protein